MTQKATPMIGLVFGKLTVISSAGRNANGQPRFNCKCECGEVVIRVGSALRYAVNLGQAPNCGAHRRRPGSVARDDAMTDRRKKGRVTATNYRDVARSFNPEQVRRLAAIMRRHDRQACYFCSRGLACFFAAEAVEVVLLEGALRLDAPRGDERYWSLDYRRQEMYV